MGALLGTIIGAGIVLWVLSVCAERLLIIAAWLVMQGHRPMRREAREDDNDPVHDRLGRYCVVVDGKRRR